MDQPHRISAAEINLPKEHRRRTTQLSHSERTIEYNSALSNAHFSNSTANGLDDFQFVGINDFDLGLVTDDDEITRPLHA